MLAGAGSIRQPLGFMSTIPDGAVVDLTDVPVAAGASSVASFYERVLAATWHLLDDGGWISVQSGTPDAFGEYQALPPIIDRIRRAHAADVERRAVYGPSYGEAAGFLSERKR
jgi:hypothetical protein